MNPADRCEHGRQPLEIERLLTEDQRRDAIDRGESHQWEVSNSKRKAVAGLLSLLDQLAEDDSNREGQN